jgi:hypothetical protein
MGPIFGARGHSSGAATRPMRYRTGGFPCSLFLLSRLSAHCPYNCVPQLVHNAATHPKSAGQGFGYSCSDGEQNFCCLCWLQG